MLAESGPIIGLDRDSRCRPGAAAGIWACGSQKAVFALERGARGVEGARQHPLAKDSCTPESDMTLQTLNKASDSAKSSRRTCSAATLVGKNA